MNKFDRTGGVNDLYIMTDEEIEHSMNKLDDAFVVGATKQEAERNKRDDREAAIFTGFMIVMSSLLCVSCWFFVLYLSGLTK
jgi:hypothetical protein